MSEALRLAIDLESIFISEDVHTNKAKRIAAELRRLAAVEQELEALKRAISDAEPVAWQLPDTEASAHYGKDIFVYYGKADFLKGAKPEKVFQVLEPLYTLKGIK